MGFLGSLLGGRKRSPSGVTPEVAKIFEKISRVLDDEALQNTMLGPDIQKRIEAGVDADELAPGEAEFGRSANNPIPVNGPIGELVYLSRLKTQVEGRRLLFHRLGSLNSIDVYETVSIDGRRWDILYLSLYHPRRSRMTPSGYSMADAKDHPLLFGTNLRVDGFPFGLQQAIRQTTKEIFGFALPPPQVRQAEETVKFEPGPDHEERISQLFDDLDGFRRA